MGTLKTDLITFKVEHSLAELIDRLPNKSEFIRNALLGALANTCPLCQGAGVLSPEQNEHWKHFTEHHRVERCGDCQAVYLSCELGLGAGLGTAALGAGELAEGTSR